MAPALSGDTPWFRWLMFGYFASHIPISLCIGGQVVLHPWVVRYPSALRRLLQIHVEANGDFLMASPPSWLRSLLAAELLLQLPFFPFAAAAFWRASPADNAMRLPCIIYGTHVVTTQIPILAAIVLDTEHVKSESHRWKLFGMYVPYLAVPLLLTAVMLARPAPFSFSKKIT
ncbi:unnamed protein product [Polarella glacialis]|uniref:EXPERA domain-containing protein n=1 Tax=Polarella glacialis TaxID=89957 RepID=A0A813FG80_POLGL|nr:unnamed protein product [Polarella glacialis]CAE8666710.1 unnamed protein product [Polarella glacialis]